MWCTKKSFSKSAHIATADGQKGAKRAKLSTRYGQCMGKTIFMGTIKPNCFNLIGNFSSFCCCRTFCIFEIRRHDVFMHLWWALGRYSKPDFTCFHISGDFIHNWNMRDTHRTSTTMLTESRANWVHFHLMQLSCFHFTLNFSSRTCCVSLGRVRLGWIFFLEKDENMKNLNLFSYV